MDKGVDTEDSHSGAIQVNKNLKSQLLGPLSGNSSLSCPSTSETGVICTVPSQSPP